MSQFSNQSDLPTDTYSMTPANTSDSKSGTNANPKKVSAIAAATLLLGGAAWFVAQKTKGEGGDKPQDPVVDEPIASNTTPAIELPQDIDVAGKVTDKMTFEQAFAAARQEVGMGGVFGWHGHWYNTFHKEEWGGLSLEQRQQYTEDIAGEKLPVKIYGSPATHKPEGDHKPEAQITGTDPEPTIIEGSINGQRVMGLDYNQDGVIDTLVLDGADGYTYKVVDARGDDGLDTLYRYNSLSGELVEAERLEEPFVLTNDQFNEGLEASMSEEVIVYILETDIDTPTEVSVPEDTTPETNTSETTGTPDVHSFRDQEMDEYRANENEYLTDSNERDDTYINNGDVRDMHE